MILNNVASSMKLVLLIYTPPFSVNLDSKCYLGLFLRQQESNNDAFYDC